MPVTAKCASCQAKFRGPDEKAGKRSKCPKCGELMTFAASDGIRATTTPPPASPVPRKGHFDEAPSNILHQVPTGALVGAGVLAAVVVVFVVGGLLRNLVDSWTGKPATQVTAVQGDSASGPPAKAEIPPTPRKEQPKKEEAKKDVGRDGEPKKEPFKLEAKKVIIKQEPEEKPKAVNVMDLHKEFVADKQAFRKKWHTKPVYAYGMVSEMMVSNSDKTRFVTTKILHSYNFREVQDRIWFVFAAERMRGTALLFPGFEAQLKADGSLAVPFGVGKLLCVEGIMFSQEPKSQENDFVDFSIVVSDLK